MIAGLTIADTCEVLRAGIRAEGVDATSVSLVNDSTIKICFVAKSAGSVDLKTEAVVAMCFVHGFLKDRDESDFAVEYIAAEGSEACGKTLMHVISPWEAVVASASGNPLVWLQKSVFQDHSEEFVQGIAKRRVSDLENGLRRLVAKTLLNAHGPNWWTTRVGNAVRTSTEGMYERQEGVQCTDGEKLIFFTFLLDLRKIVVFNWSNFVSVFEHQPRFDDLLNRLNVVRRAEAHNRALTDDQMIALDSIYKELMERIATAMPEACCNFLVENWRSQLAAIFESHVEAQKRLPEPPKGDVVAAITLVQRQITLYDDLVTRVSSIIVPPGKASLHDELITRIKGVRDTLGEMVAITESGDFHKLSEAQRRNEKANAEIREFQKNYLLSEL